MSECIIVTRSATISKKAERVLKATGIPVNIVNIDPSLTKRGCAYGLAVSCDRLERALDVLDRRRIIHGEVIGRI